ncbi:unnamed protein product [Caenorhabditis angaria]|uniref:Uncharacterized protein n=1 Tax=Caenorhabditis angaria TaxID=860376 RepID=A0A9P1N906_9PELO|nr:unnamed protein product [Caenorhabditis angaria]
MSSEDEEPCSSTTEGFDFMKNENDETQLCLVCLKPAVGKHYKVPACHGCKSFFRRAILRNIIYPPCKYEAQCYQNISITNRPQKCRFCRYQKCYDVGMVAYFLYDRRKSENGMKLIESVSRFGIRDDITIIDDLISDLSDLDVKISEYRVSKFNPIKHPDLETLIKSPNQLHQATHFEKMPGWPLSQEEFIQQQRRLIEIKIRIEGSQLPAETKLEQFDIKTKEWLPFDMMMAVEFAKTFTFFDRLEFSDKLALMKKSTFMSLALTTAFNSYKAKMGIIQTPDGACISGPTRNEQAVRHFERVMSLRIMEPLIRDKFTIPEYLLLKAIVVCNSASTLSKHGQRIVENEKNKFGKALLEYCFLQYGKKEGGARYSKILNYIDVLEHYQRDFRDFMKTLQIFTPNLIPESRRKLQNEVLCLEE